MKHQTSSLKLCGQPTALTFIQSTTRFGGSCRSVCTAARFVTSTICSRARSKSGNISTRWSSIKRSGSGTHVFELAFDFEHTVDILITNFRCAEVLSFARTLNWHSITPVPIVDTCCSCCRCWPILLKFGDLFAIYPHSVGLEFVEIRHCLPELWQRIQCYSFFVDTV